MGMGQGRQMKICTSLLMGIFVVYLLIFGEEEVKKFEEFREMRSEKELLRSRSIKNYNYSYMMELQENINKIFTTKGKQNLQKLEELPMEDKQVIVYFCEDNQWDALVNGMFELMDEDDDSEVSQDEYTDFSQKLLQENKDHQKAILKQFERINGKKGFNKEQFTDHMQFLQKILNNTLNEDVENKKHSKIGNQLLNLVETGIQINNKKSENQQEKRQRERFDFFSHEGNEKHWKIVERALFKIIDKNDDKLINDEEIQYFLGKIDLDMQVEDWFRKQFLQIDANLDQSQEGNRSFFSKDQNVSIDEDEFEAFSMRIYQLYMNYNGVSLEHNKFFDFYYAKDKENK